MLTSKVIALWQNYENSPELIELGRTTKESIQGWRDVLLAFRLKVDRKYATSMSPGGSVNWAKDVSKKVLWLKEKEDIDLMSRLQLASDTVSVLIYGCHRVVTYNGYEHWHLTTYQAI